MSNTIYSIKYDNNSFFSSNPNVKNTFPFEVSAVIDWAKDKYLSYQYKNTDNLFEEELSKVIIKNQAVFIDDFLLNNASFNSDFSGNLFLSTEFEEAEPTASESGPDDIKVGDYTFNGTRITSRNGSTSYVIGKPGVQRVNFQPTCTINHMHFPGPNGCIVQKNTNAKEETYYKCLCTGTPVFNAEPHAHCSEFTNNIQNPQTAYNTAYSSTAATTSMMRIASQSTQNQIGNNIDETAVLDLEYENSEDLKRLNYSIRAIIYEYYKAVKENVDYRNAIEKRQKSIDTQELALTDSTVKYKKEYLTAFNFLTGIIVVGGYIYGMNKV